MNLTSSSLALTFLLLSCSLPFPLTSSPSFHQLSSADGDVVTLRPQDIGHHGAPGSPEGEAAAHRAAAGRAGPGASRDGQGHQPHLRGGEGAGRRQGAARAGTKQTQNEQEEATGGAGTQINLSAFHSM